MPRHGFLRAAAAVPRLRVADCRFNAEQTIASLEGAADADVDFIVFPELGLSGYTCGDLFHQVALQQDAIAALAAILKASERFPGLAVVGLPFVVDQRLFNVAAAVQSGKLLALVPKSYLPNYKEFYEDRWFAPGTEARSQIVSLLGQEVPFGTDILLDANVSFPGLAVGIEICEDLWVPIPPSTRQALAGATLLCNLSASNEIIGKASYRRQMIGDISGRCIAGYVYTSSGVDESTTDLVFGGHAMIAENGSVVAETQLFQRDGQMIVADLDIERLVNDRQKITSFFRPGATDAWRRIPFSVPEPPAPRILRRRVEAHPFVPSGQTQLAERCQDIFHTQVAGLAKRLEHIGRPTVTLGVSGGLDSTLALLVTCKTLDLLSLPRSHLTALTMPGFGTTDRTRGNALALMRLLQVNSREIDIRSLCLEEMRALGHRPFGIDLEGLDAEALAQRLGHVPAERRQDLVFENVQARMRTSLLMNRGFVIGTGDISELALGWCTYNGDHMSMYNPNVSIPKTLVKFLVRWAAENEFDGEVRRTLLDIVETRISPELLPIGVDGKMMQETEGVIGPYELLDFFLFHFLRYGAPPEKILYLAGHATFDQSYSSEQIAGWLRVFLKRFFANQFKRSCLPDGPKVGSISLSPRGDWRMPSDAAARAWLERVTGAPAQVDGDIGREVGARPPSEKKGPARGKTRRMPSSE
ncbi:MAG: NAD(+) synthase [Gemmataceae bacterium]